MKCLFPGMDPYLEIDLRWEGFHNWFVRVLAQQTMPSAEGAGCWIDVERTIYPHDTETLRCVKHDHLVFRELDRFDCIRAVVEVLSPANKSGSYRKRYREKRRTFLESRAHFMEIDLLRSGENPARQLFPEIEPTPYFIFVARKTPTGRKEEAYPRRLQDPLPVIGLPIGPPRPDLPLDLASAFQSAYQLSVRRGSIDDTKEPVPAPPYRTPMPPGCARS